MKAAAEAMLTLKVVDILDNPHKYGNPTAKQVHGIISNVATCTGEPEIVVLEIFERVVQAALDTLNGGNNAQNH